MEATIKGAAGATKKKVVMDVIANVAAAGEKIPEAHVQQISGLVDVVVGALNKSGVFTSTPSPVTA